jgi:hypothetical protein
MADVIHVGKLECRYFTSHDHPSPQMLQHRLDDVTQKAFAPALSAAFENALPEPDPGVWLLRRLNLSLEAATDWDQERLTGAWARVAARTVVERIENVNSDPEVLHFASRAAYLAQFLADLARGQAWDKWYYWPFSGLRLLATPDAIVAAILNDIGNSPEALQSVPEAGMQQILAVLHARHCERIWHALVVQPSPSATEQDLLEPYKRWSAVKPALPSFHHRCLWLLHSTAGLAHFNAIEAVAALEQARLSLTAGGFDDLLIQLHRGSIAQAFIRVGGDLAARLNPWTDVSEALLQTIRKPDAQTISEKNAEPPVSATSFGCVFLLLPAIASFPTESAAVRFAMFEHCVPAALRAHVRRDPLLHELFQTDSAEAVFDSAHLLAGFHQWLRNEEYISGEQAEELRAGEFTIAVDPLRGHWLSLQPAAKATISHPDFTFLEPGLSDCDRVLCLIARAMLKSFAWRLPGFAESSLNHLWSNFLDIFANMQLFDDRRVVRVSKPPLHLVMSLTGMLNVTYSIPWLALPVVSLFPES